MLSCCHFIYVRMPDCSGNTSVTVYARCFGLMFVESTVIFHTDCEQYYSYSSYIHTYIHLLNGPFSGTTQVSWYQKGKTNLDFTGARDSGWQWHQLGHMQLCTSLQTDNHASTPPLSFFTGRMPFLPPNQRSQSTEGIIVIVHKK